MGAALWGSSITMNLVDDPCPRSRALLSKRDPRIAPAYEVLRNSRAMRFPCSELPDPVPLRASIVTGLGVMNVFAAVRESGTPRRRLEKIVATGTIGRGPAIGVGPSELPSSLIGGE